jgi:ABC-type Fe3+-hydroxamate transport system substrate-binding protein
MGVVAMGRLGLAALVALLLLLSTACGERSEPTGPTALRYPLTVQSATDRPVVVTKPALRIAVLDRPAEAILQALGVGGRIVMQAPMNRIDFTMLRRSHPDLVVASQDADLRDLSRAAAVTRAQVYTAPGDSIHQVEHAITQLGLLTGRPIAARALVRRIETQRHDVQVRLARVANVSVFVDTGFFTTVSDQSLIGDVIREAHGTNVAGAAAEAGPVDISELLQLDPDVYLATSDTGVTLADLRKHPRLRKLRALRKGHFAIANADLLEPGPRIGEGLAQVARLLHPNAFR